MRIADDARAIARCAPRFGFPLLAHVARENPIRRVSPPSTGFVAERAVVADRRSADEHRRRSCCAANRGGEAARRLHAAVENALLLRGGPAPAGDRFAGQIHDRAGAVDLRGPRTALAVRDPTRPRARRAASRQAAASHGVRTTTSWRSRTSAASERTAEEAGAAGDDDLHACFNPARASKIPRRIAAIRRWNRRRRP